MTESVAASIAASVDGYLARGSGYWPGAHHFVLLEVDLADECLTGAGWNVCHSCIGLAARTARERLIGEATVVLDLVGETDGAEGRCHLCGGEL